MKHFVYQRIHTLAGKPLHLAAHLDIAVRAFQHIYGGERLVLDEKVITKKLAAQLRESRFPIKGSATVILRLTPTEAEVGACAETTIAILATDTPDTPTGIGTPNNLENTTALRAALIIEPERLLLDVGYTLSSLRPRAVSYDYNIPFGAYPTGFQLSSAALFDTLALTHYGATRSIRRDGDKLLSCGDAPLFGIRGNTLFTAPFIDGAMDSVERRLVIAAGVRAKLDFLEESPSHSELSDFDELFFADPGGITSLAECDNVKFMSLLVGRLVACFPPVR